MISRRDYVRRKIGSTMPRYDGEPGLAQIVLVVSNSIMAPTPALQSTIPRLAIASNADEGRLAWQSQQGLRTTLMSQDRPASMQTSPHHRILTDNLDNRRGLYSRRMHSGSTGSHDRIHMS
jgi:hypothetical protein